MKVEYTYLLIFISIFLFSLFFLISRGKNEYFSEGVVGTSFVSRVPRGTIVAYAPDDTNNPQAPPGWVICNGGKTADGKVIPDLSGRFIMGYSSSGCGINSKVGDDCNKLQGKGGEYTHTLSKDELAPHTHSWNVGLDGVSGSGEPAWSDWPNATQTVKSSNTGDGLIGNPHNNTPPYVVLMYIMKT